MVKKKIDNRIRVMIENGVKLGHRTMFIVVGDKGRDQVRSKNQSLNLTITTLVSMPFLGSDSVRYADQIHGQSTSDSAMVLQKQRRCHFKVMIS